MVKVAFDREDPPGEPPEDAGSEMLWRIAVQLFRDHSTGSGGPPGHGQLRCRSCGQPWPCSGRRLAALGLSAAAT